MELEESPLTVEQAAKTLNLSQACLRSWIAARRVSYYKLGRAIRIPVKEIRRLLEASSVSAREDYRADPGHGGRARR
jgi:excisionase family DNA binding protein